MYVNAIGRCLVTLKRIAAALDRMAPPVQKKPRRVEFSMATNETFEKGYDRSRFDAEDDGA